MVNRVYQLDARFERLEEKLVGARRSIERIRIELPARIP